MLHTDDRCLKVLQECYFAAHIGSALDALRLIQGPVVTVPFGLSSKLLVHIDLNVSMLKCSYFITKFAIVRLCMFIVFDYCFMN